MIIAISGASGVGKTTILSEVSQKITKDQAVKVFHFDDMGLPNWDEVEDTKKWQEEATVAWIDKLVTVAREEKAHVLFEGSTDIKFYIQGFAKNAYEDYKLILFDCQEESMRTRLIGRGQPELYHADMIGWLNYLRREAIQRKVEIIETDSATASEIADRIIGKLNLK